MNLPTADRSQIEDLIIRLASQGLTLAVAESSSGGLLGATITACPGASAVFLGGVIAYTDQAKVDCCCVGSDLLAEHGAVSGEVARAMAEGVRTIFEPDIAVAVTGITNPPPDDQPTWKWKTGHTCMHFIFKDGSDLAVARVYTGDRDTIRSKAIRTVVNTLLSSRLR